MVNRMVIKRGKKRVDTGIMGFHDYETEWESIENFTARVCNKIDDIFYDESKKYYSSHFLSNSGGMTDCAVIIYEEF